MPEWPSQSDVDSFFGNPRGANGEASAKWEQQNLVLVRVPWELITSWDNAPVKGIRIHHKCSESLEKILQAIWISAGQKEEVIKDWGMNLYGGGYTFKRMTASHRLSMHSWGCAIDFDPARNGYGDVTPNFANCPEVLNAFATERWTWGGSWSKPDGMHWQAAKV